MFDSGNARNEHKYYGSPTFGLAINLVRDKHDSTLNFKTNMENDMVGRGMKLILEGAIQSQITEAGEKTFSDLAEQKKLIQPRTLAQSIYDSKIPITPFLLDSGLYFEPELQHHWNDLWDNFSYSTIRSDVIFIEPTPEFYHYYKRKVKAGHSDNLPHTYALACEKYASKCRLNMSGIEVNSMDDWWVRKGGLFNFQPQIETLNLGLHFRHDSELCNARMNQLNTMKTNIRFDCSNSKGWNGFQAHVYKELTTANDKNAQQLEKVNKHLDGGTLEYLNFLNQCLEDLDIPLNENIINIMHTVTPAHMFKLQERFSNQFDEYNEYTGRYMNTKLLQFCDRCSLTKAKGKGCERFEQACKCKYYKNTYEWDFCDKASKLKGIKPDKKFVCKGQRPFKPAIKVKYLQDIAKNKAIKKLGDDDLVFMNWDWQNHVRCMMVKLFQRVGLEWQDKTNAITGKFQMNGKGCAVIIFNQDLLELIQKYPSMIKKQPVGLTGYAFTDE